MNEIIKMSHIGTIQVLYKQTYGYTIEFDVLQYMTIRELENFRDNLIPLYNDVIEARQFGADMIYKRKKERQNVKR